MVTEEVINRHTGKTAILDSGWVLLWDSLFSFFHTLHSPPFFPSFCFSSSLSSSASGHVLLWWLHFLCRGKVSLLASLNGFYDGLDMIVSLYISLSVKVYLTQLCIWQALSFWMSSAAAWYLEESVKCFFLLCCLRDVLKLFTVKAQ